MFVMKHEEKEVWYEDFRENEPVFTADIESAKKLGVSDAYSIFAGMSDQRGIFLRAQATDKATEGECRELGRIAAKDLFQNPSDKTIEALELGFVERFM